MITDHVLREEARAFYRRRPLLVSYNRHGRTLYVDHPRGITAVAPGSLAIWRDDGEVTVLSGDAAAAFLELWEEETP